MSGMRSIERVHNRLSRNLSTRLAMRYDTNAVPQCNALVLTCLKEGR